MPRLLVSLLIAPLLATAGGSRALAEGLDGAWVAPFGPLEVVQKSDRVVGSPQGSSACQPPLSGHLLEGDLLEDSLSGQLYVCLTGCDKGAGWVPVLLLVSPDGKSLSGTSTLPRGCSAPLGPHGSLVLRRASTADSASARAFAHKPSRSSPPPLQASAPAAPAESVPGRPPVNLAHGSPAPELAAPPPTSAPESPRPGPTSRPVGVPSPSVVGVPRPVESPEARARALELARDGLSFQQEGKFEQARHRFQQAIEVDPLYAEGFNGVGVTFFARNDYVEALRWYKRALAADPAFGDAYYNMACVYALQKRGALAMRYLRTAFHNGYTSRETLRDDADLAALHGTPSFEALLGEAQ